MKTLDTLASISRLDTLNLDQAAALLRLGRDATKALVEKGDIPALQCNQKHTVLLRTDVLDYIAREARHQADERKSRTRFVAEHQARRGRRATPLPNLDLYERTKGTS